MTQPDPRHLLQNIKRSRYPYGHYGYIPLIYDNQLMTYDSDGSKIDEQLEDEKEQKDEEEGTKQRWISKGYSGASKIRPKQ